MNEKLLRWKLNKAIDESITEASDESSLPEANCSATIVKTDAFRSKPLVNMRNDMVRIVIDVPIREAGKIKAMCKNASEYM